MIDNLLHLFDMNLDYARRLVADLSEEQMTAQPAPDMNHAAWVLGHLAGTCDLLLVLLGREALNDEAWDELFGNRSSPVADPSRYPSKAELLAALERGHQAVADTLRTLDPARLDDPTPHDAIRKGYPKLGMFVTHGLSGHEQLHLGQLSAWRRAQGLPSV